MAPNSGTPGPQAKLPSTTDFNQVFNRINLSLSKHSSFLQNIRARHPPPPPPAAAAAAPATASQRAPSTTTSAGFSSLAAKSSSSAAKPANPSHTRRGRADLDAAVEAQFAEHSADVAAAALGSNAGIGYVPERRAAERAVEDRDLRGRLLGKRAREQREEAAAANSNKRRQRRRGGAESSGDEDDVGRSGLGRSKKKAAAAATSKPYPTQQYDLDDMDSPPLSGRPETSEGAGLEVEMVQGAVPDGPEIGDISKARASPVADELGHKIGPKSKNKRKKSKKPKGKE